uniref:Uncharacterized protein n=1 Tax=Siphoviridae sp. ctSP74 TaxID=2826343 RepID=A0A8S5NP66_9CAUD|nr:MAG TPA: hypothetical protein [Siphoviridae sp. ctSP74]
MLVNINDDILELLKLDDLEETKDNKKNDRKYCECLYLRWNVDSFRI